MSAPKWLTDDEQRAWRAYLAMNSKLARQLNRELSSRSGLSDADYEVLVNLSEASGGRLRAFELANAIVWEKSRLSHHLTRMEARGLVTREECSTDGRGAFFVITKNGRDTIKRAAPHHVAAVRNYFLDALTPAQVRSLEAIATAVTARLGEG